MAETPGAGAYTRRVAAVLLDIDGVLTLSGAALPGAVEAVARLRTDGHALRFVTNNTIRSRSTLALELRELGFALDTTELETTPLAAGRLLAGKRVLALTAEAIHDDLAAFVELVDADADVVLVGGAEETGDTDRMYAYESLNRAFGELTRGARLVALHKNRWWQTAAGSRLDGGAYVAALEYAAAVTAEVVGKPSRAYFQSALTSLGVGPAEAVMVGDDAETDVAAAIRLGMRGVLVRTGKFREETLGRADPAPTAVLDSIADLPAWLA
jgi:HAD superfamily hydrolase (TIGR01458 family)